MPLTHLKRLLLIVLFVALWPPAANAQWREDGVPVCTAPGIQSSPQIVTDGSGGAIIAWIDARSGGTDIYAQRLRASGEVERAWPSDGVALCTAPGAQALLTIVADGTGGAIVAWTDQRSGGVNLDIYAQRVLNSGVVDPAWPTDGLAVCTAPGSQRSRLMVEDGAGGAIVAWVDNRDFSNKAYVQHVLASGVVDPDWPLDGLAVCTAPGGQVPTAMVTDGAGGAIVAWGDQRNGDADLYAQHVLVSGKVDPDWRADGRVLASGPTEQGNSAMIADGEGGALVVWNDTYYGGFSDIYAHHLLATGILDPAWPPEGRAVSTAPNDQAHTGIIPDRRGGAFVTWSDTRSGHYEIYVHHLLASGELAPSWPTDGRAIASDPPRNRSGAGIVEDGAGGAILVWQEVHNDYFDIYAQHVRSSGALDPAWPADGRPVCTAPGNQEHFAIAADGAGRAIVTWRDHRSGNWDIYARKVYTHSAAAPRERVPGNSLAVHASRLGGGRGEATIGFDLPAADPVSVQVFDAAGRAVRTLAARQELGAGTHTLVWDGANDSGVPLKHGVYLVRVNAGAKSATAKLLILE